jgi:hypothetical protein
MIYMLIFTQLITVAAVLSATYALLRYIEQRDQAERAQVGLFVEEVVRHQLAHEEQIHAMVKTFSEQVSTMTRQAHRERELLLERYQFPEQMQAQAQSADMPLRDADDKPDPVVMDDKRLYALEHPDQEPEQLEPIQPIQARKPVTPFGEA